MENFVCLIMENSNSSRRNRPSFIMDKWAQLGYEITLILTVQGKDVQIWLLLETDGVIIDFCL